MSDLLNSASLVLIPSGYKEDTVYSVVPSDGSGDLSFTRASNGTRVNSAGLVEVTPWNLITYSEDFTNAVWTKVSATVTANSTTAPNGTNTATKFESVAAGVPQLSRSIAGTNTISIYAKAGNISNFRIWIGSEVIFDLSTGTVTAGTATMENVGNGWYRCIISATSAASVNPYFVSTASGQFVYVWGAQLNEGSTAKPYFPTTDRLNVPRLTYQNGGGGCPSLLLEKQSTNLCTYSEQLDNAAWTKYQATITANNTTSPDGTQNADKLLDNTSNDYHLFYQVISISADTTISIYVKAAEYSKFAIYNASDGGDVLFNLSTVAVISTSANFKNSKIESVGNGWYRVSATTNGTSGSKAMGYSLVNDAGAITFFGTGSKGVFVWGAQVEASSYPTSYIPTTSASATRVADAAQKTGISSLIGQTEGTIFLDYNLISASQDIVVMNAVGLPNNDIAIIFIGNSLEIYCFNNFVEQFRFSLSGYKNTNRYKIAIGYGNNNTACYINGSLVGTDTSCTFNLTDSIFYTSADYNAHKINESVLFKTRLTNAELASLTTI